MMRGVHPALALPILFAWTFGGLHVPGAEAARADVSEVPCILANEDKQRAKVVSEIATDKREKAEAKLKQEKEKIPDLEAEMNEDLAAGKADGVGASEALLSHAPDFPPVPDKVIDYIYAWKYLPIPVPQGYFDSFRGASKNGLDKEMNSYMTDYGPGASGTLLTYDFRIMSENEKELQAGKDAVANAETALKQAEAEEKAAKEWLDAATKHYVDCQGEDPPPPRKRSTRKAGELDHCESEYWLCP